MGTQNQQFHITSPHPDHELRLLAVRCSTSNVVCYTINHSNVNGVTVNCSSHSRFISRNSFFGHQLQILWSWEHSVPRNRQVTFDSRLFETKCWGSYACCLQVTWHRALMRSFKQRDTLYIKRATVCKDYPLRFHIAVTSWTSREGPQASSQISEAKRGI